MWVGDTKIQIVNEHLFQPLFSNLNCWLIPLKLTENNYVQNTLKTTNNSDFCMLSFGG